MNKLTKEFFSDVNEINLNKIEDVLEKSEEILWREKPKKSAYIWSAIIKMLPFALIWLILDLVFLTAIFGTNPPFKALLFIIPFFAIHLLPVWSWVGGIIKATMEHKNIEYAVTNKRIIIRSGVIGIDFKNLYFAEISKVSLKVNALDKFLQVGDLYITSQSQSAVLFDIKNPYAIFTKLQQIINDIKTDMLYPNALRPNENSGYNTKYKPNIEDNKK